jgi:hypothetical protein
MVNVNLTADLSLPVNRQDLFDMWTTATVDDFQKADFDDSLLEIGCETSFSDFPASPGPGKLVYHKDDMVFYCFHDEIGGTGVSQWLAWGPDKFEIACIAAEPLPAGALVDLTYDRWVSLPTAAHQVPLGVVQSGIDSSRDMNLGSEVTTASGAWCRIGVDGILVGRIVDPSSHVSDSNYTRWSQADPLCMDTNDFTYLVNAQDGRFPTFNPVGWAVQDSPAFGANATPTEPVYFFKFQFAPRVYRPFGSSTP